MRRLFAYALIFSALTLGLSACGEDKKADTKKEPAKAVEKVEPKKEATAPKKEDDMTPSEALDNMQRDAGKVADKATEVFNAAKDAATKALSE